MITRYAIISLEMATITFTPIYYFLITYETYTAIKQTIIYTVISMCGGKRHGKSNT